MIQHCRTAHSIGYWWEKEAEGEKKCVREARHKARRQQGRRQEKTPIHTDPTHIVPTQAPLFKSEVHCSVILHIISQFALSDWYIEMVNRNVRQDYCEPNQEIEKCDRGARLAERKSGGVWMKEILQGKKQMDKLMVQWSASLSNAICQSRGALP